ncbi:hypothetical protein NRIC_18810 [Enterococcus florum]|uniref:Uncharacterized protein n=1 Tax=Enterococcus florum TaxID=2480627 RepID=A0A4P5P823_9ENTE|nr:hypothetical protein [Enterococcus florum]GCF93990.1 hypothetical protein NRIC_18810 [Enterococcus florum]
MRVLFIFEDGERSSFFVYKLHGRDNALIRVSPEVPLKGITLGMLYTKVDIKKFLYYFSTAFAIEVTKYLILKKSDSLLAIAEAGLENDRKMSVYSPKSFVSEKTGTAFVAGEQRLTLKEIEAYIEYQVDRDGKMDVFERQEDIIRLMKRKTVRPSLSSVTKHYGTVKEFSGSNLNLKDMLKMGTGYLAKGSAHMKKEMIPAEGSYQLSKDFPYRVIRIDWEKNPYALKKEFR